MRHADFFEMKNYIYTENKRKFIIAGAYYIHMYNRDTRRWQVLGKSIFHKYMGIHNLVTANTRLQMQTL
jgi:acyl-ACP thioesterase